MAFLCFRFPDKTSSLSTERQVETFSTNLDRDVNNIAGLYQDLDDYRDICCGFFTEGNEGNEEKSLSC